jgi:hypothetical protein
MLKLNKRINLFKSNNPIELVSGCKYAIDEMKVLVYNKQQDLWLIYSFCRESKKLVDFVIGNRSKKKFH